MSADKYLLRVTAGPSYDPSTHTEVPVNGPTATAISGDACTASVKVRIQNYRGLPHGSPTTSAYFKHPPHEKDQYSIAFSFVPHKTISASSLVFGNDFDRPIRDRLPPGFSIAMKIVQKVIDPGLDGDVYADQPYLYGPLLSSINTLRIGDKLEKKGEKYEIPPNVHEDGITEGADGKDAEEVREKAGLPADAGKRKSYALDKSHREKFDWEAGRLYQGDFFNPYLDFNDFSLKLPGFSLSVLRFLDGKDSLRYTLKNKETGEVLFVVVLALIHKEELEKEEADKGKQDAKEKTKDEPVESDGQEDADDVD